jgi:hypothetical protein
MMANASPYIDGDDVDVGAVDDVGDGDDVDVDATWARRGRDVGDDFFLTN